ncbi:hypothetical protein ACJX0J_026521, partial [Zea mays]
KLGPVVDNDGVGGYIPWMGMYPVEDNEDRIQQLLEVGVVDETSMFFGVYDTSSTFAWEVQEQGRVAVAAWMQGDASPWALTSMFLGGFVRGAKARASLNAAGDKNPLQNLHSIFYYYGYKLSSQPIAHM